MWHLPYFNRTKNDHCSFYMSLIKLDSYSFIFSNLYVYWTSARTMPLSKLYLIIWASYLCGTWISTFIKWAFQYLSALVRSSCVTSRLKLSGICNKHFLLTSLYISWSSLGLISSCGLGAALLHMSPILLWPLAPWDIFFSWQKTGT